MTLFVWLLVQVIAKFQTSFPIFKKKVNLKSSRQANKCESACIANISASHSSSYDLLAFLI